MVESQNSIHRKTHENGELLLHYRTQLNTGLFSRTFFSQRNSEDSGAESPPASTVSARGPGPLPDVLRREHLLPNRGAFRKGLLRRSQISLCIFGAIAMVVINGGIMNLAAALIYANFLNWQLFFSYYDSCISVDLVHAAATVLILWFAAEPMLEKLDRIKVKYGLMD